jgi:ribosome-associated toxin RatA of RatAB toxin-antitoxin module
MSNKVLKQTKIKKKEAFSEQFFPFCYTLKVYRDRTNAELIARLKLSINHTTSKYAIKSTTRSRNSIEMRASKTGWALVTLLDSLMGNFEILNITSKASQTY